VEAGGALRLSDSDTLKVNANPFALPEPDVPPAEQQQDVPFG